MKLSVVMMVKNESKHLEDVLESINPIREKIDCEIIVLDTGSSDNTVEIAKKYTDKVYFETWNNNFSSMRNKSISYAVGEWIFILDGDEVLSNQDSLIDFFESAKDKEVNSAFVNLKNITNELEGSFNVALLRRIFRNDEDFRYIGSIHEQATYKEPHTILDLTLIHYGYLATDSELMEEKFQRNSKLLHAQLKKDPQNIYILHHLSNIYGMHMEQDKALYYIKKAYSIAKLKRVNLSRTMYVYINLATALWNNKKYSSLKKICKEAIKANNNYMDFFYYLGNVYSMMGDTDKAIDNFEHYLSLVRDYKDPDLIKNVEFTQNTISHNNKVIAILCNLYEKDKKYEKVIQYSKEIDDITLLKKTLAMVINAYLELKDYQGLVDFTKDKLVSSNNDVGNSFYYQLEKYMFNPKNNKQKDIIIELFSHGDSNYNILNKTRLEIKANKGEFEQSLVSQIIQMDFSILADYYGDLVYYLLINNQPIYDLLSKVHDSKLNKYLYHLSKSYDNLGQVLGNYIRSFKFEENMQKTRINKHLLRYALLFSDSEDDNYTFLFNRYAEEGIHYISFYYSKDFINSEFIYDAKSTEDEFFIYLYKAFESKDLDELLYVKHLRKALEVYPEMSKGIESLISDYSKPNEEINEVVEVLKQQIGTLLSQSLFQDALRAVNEALQIIPANADLYSIKAIVLLSLEEYDEAIETLKKGLLINPSHVDNLYNLAYIYELKGSQSQALELYNKILITTKEEELINELEDKVKSLENTQ